MKMILLSTMMILIGNVQASGNLENKIAQKKSESAIPAEVRSEFERATKELKESGIEKSATTVGAVVPNFKIGKEMINDLYKKGPVVVTFYRGGWCPYCMLQLQEFEKVYSEIQNKGGTLIALTPDLSKEIKKTKKKFSISFPIYTDKDNHIAKQFGIAFKVDQKVEALYQKFGINLDASQGNKEKELPMPGTYVINKEGKIVYAFIDADYTKRAEPQELLKFLE